MFFEEFWYWFTFNFWQNIICNWNFNCSDLCVSAAACVNVSCCIFEFWRKREITPQVKLIDICYFRALHSGLGVAWTCLLSNNLCLPFAAPHDHVVSNSWFAWGVIWSERWLLVRLFTTQLTIVHTGIIASRCSATFLVDFPFLMLLFYGKNGWYHFSVPMKLVFRRRFIPSLAFRQRFNVLLLVHDQDDDLSDEKWMWETTLSDMIRLWRLMYLIYYHILGT